MIKPFIVLVSVFGFSANALEIKRFGNQGQIKADFLQRTADMSPRAAGMIKNNTYRINHEELDTNGDGKADVQMWGMADLGRPSQRRVYLCASTEKDCSKGGYCYAGYFPGPEIDKGIPDLKCKE
ncbi:hypothetical protein [Rheinheimera texasensis]|uniref:hypothetical protein n=1 Tax=Rheinheimera texasensis TaxID=306205 RepID=UPI0032B22681